MAPGRDSSSELGAATYSGQVQMPGRPLPVPVSDVKAHTLMGAVEEAKHQAFQATQSEHGLPLKARNTQQADQAATLKSRMKVELHKRSNDSKQ